LKQFWPCSDEKRGLGNWARFHKNIPLKETQNQALFGTLQIRVAGLTHADADYMQMTPAGKPWTDMTWPEKGEERYKQFLPLQASSLQALRRKNSISKE